MYFLLPKKIEVRFWNCKFLNKNAHNNTDPELLRLRFPYLTNPTGTSPCMLSCNTCRPGIYRNVSFHSLLFNLKLPPLKYIVPQYFGCKSLNLMLSMVGRLFGTNLMQVYKTRFLANPLCKVEDGKAHIPCLDNTAARVKIILHHFGEVQFSEMCICVCQGHF